MAARFHTCLVKSVMANRSLARSLLTTMFNRANQARASSADRRRTKQDKQLSPPSAIGLQALIFWSRRGQMISYARSSQQAITGQLTRVTSLRLGGRGGDGPLGQRGHDPALGCSGRHRFAPLGPHAAHPGRGAGGSTAVDDRSVPTARSGRALATGTSTSIQERTVPTITTVHHPAARSSTINDIAYDACTNSGEWVPVTRRAWRRIRRTEQRIRSYLAGRRGRPMRCSRIAVRRSPRARRVARRTVPTRGSSDSDSNGPGEAHGIARAIERGARS